MLYQSDAFENSGLWDHWKPRGVMGRAIGAPEVRSPLWKPRGRVTVVLGPYGSSQSPKGNLQSSPKRPTRSSWSNLLHPPVKCPQDCERSVIEPVPPHSAPVMLVRLDPRSLLLPHGAAFCRVVFSCTQTVALFLFYPKTTDLS